MRTTGFNPSNRCLVALATVLSLGAAGFYVDAAGDALRRGGVVRVAMVQAALGAAEHGALPSADLLACAAGLALLLAWAASVPWPARCTLQPIQPRTVRPACDRVDQCTALIRAASRGGRHGP